MSAQPTATQLRAAKEKRADQVRAFTELSAKLGTADWVEDTHGPEFRSLQTQITESDTLIERLNDAALLQARSASDDGGTGGGTGGGASATSVAVIDADNRGDKWDAQRRNYSITKAMRATGYGKLEGRELEMHQQAAKQARDMNLATEGNLLIPMELLYQERFDEGMQRRDITASPGSAGGFTIETKLGPLVEFLYPRLVLRDMGAMYMPGQSANLAFSRNTVAGEASWAGEQATAAEISPEFDLLTLSAKRLGVTIDVSKMNLAQSSIPMENYVRRTINKAMMTKLDRTGFDGSGVGVIPRGILNTVGVNDIDLGTNGGLMTWAKIVRMEALLAEQDADMGDMGYVFTAGVMGHLKTEKRDVAGNQFIVEGSNQAAIVNGYRARATNVLPRNLSKGTGTNLHAAVFGNFADFVIAQFGVFDLLVNPYTKGKEATVELTATAFYDMGCLRAQSFTICNEIVVPT